MVQGEELGSFSNLLNTENAIHIGCSERDQGRVVESSTEVCERRC